MQPRGVDNPLGVIEGGTLVTRAGRIAWVGTDQAYAAWKVRAAGFNLDRSHRDDSDLPTWVDGLPEIAGEGKLLTPGLIDCHTHLIFAGSRAEDWRQRLLGRSYADIARSGGGILSTMRATRDASEDELFRLAIPRLQDKLREGVTTVEIKSGYGLDAASERKMLAVGQRLAELLPIDISTTCLAAHAVPPEFSQRADDYIAHVCQVILPACAELCEAVDVFCESIAFNREQTRRVFQAAQSLGKGIKIHAEQLSLAGGAELAAEMGAWSADHLEYLDEAGTRRMASAGTVATLLPGAYYFLREPRKPPVALFRQWGVPMAVATDFNPGSSPSNSLLLSANLAVTLFELTPEEAWLGITRNAAAALKREREIGTLEVGKRADLVTWDCQNVFEPIYFAGSMNAMQVFSCQ